MPVCDNGDLNGAILLLVVVTVHWHYPCYDDVNMSGYGCMCGDDAATLSKTHRAH